MGRTLHYTATTANGKAFTEHEINAMYETSIYYNSGEFKNVWTCENFFLDYYSYYPNWDYFPENERNTAWDKVIKMYEDLRREHFPHSNAVKIMLRKKVILLHGGLDGVKRNEARGFTKTQGNEYNSMLVYLALCAISKKAPNLIIHLSDEGDYLLCPLYIRQGKVMPDFERLEENIDRWSKSLLMPKIQEDIKDILEGMPEEAIQEVGLNTSYSDCALKYFREAIQKVKTIFFILIEQGLSGNELYVFNLRHRKPKDWFEPLLFSRAVDPNDFRKDNKEGFTYIMSGFYGEYWNRNGNKDAEAESYRMLSNITKLLPKDCELEILPKIRKA
jgi:hypothetical protein